MAELADALDLGSSAREGVGVQVSPGARRISEMRTRFSDLVFPIGEIRWPLRQPVVLFTVGSHPPIPSISLFVVGSHLPAATRSPRAGATVLPPAHARAVPRSAYPPCAGLASRPGAQRPSEPLFHHAVSKRPDHQLHAIMCPRLCHGGRQVSLHRRRL